MIKLTEIDNNAMLKVGDNLMTKEDFVNSELFLNYEKNPVLVTVAKKVVAKFDLADCLCQFCEQEELYEDCFEDLLYDIRDEDLAMIEKIVNKALEINPTYYEGEPIQVML